MRRQAARHQSSRHTLTVHQRWQRGRRPYPPLHSGAHRNQTRRVPRAPRPAPRWQEQQRRLPVRLAQSVRSALPPSPPSFEDERERLLRELPAGPLEPAYAHERAERKAKRKGEKLAQSAGGGEGGGGKRQAGTTYEVRSASNPRWASWRTCGGDSEHSHSVERAGHDSLGGPSGQGGACQGRGRRGTA